MFKQVVLAIGMITMSKDMDYLETVTDFQTITDRIVVFKFSHI